MSYLTYTEYEVGEYVIFSGKVYQISEIYIVFDKVNMYKDYILTDPKGYDVPYPVAEHNLKRLLARK